MKRGLREVPLLCVGLLLSGCGAASTPEPDRSAGDESTPGEVAAGGGRAAAGGRPAALVGDGAAKPGPGGVDRGTVPLGEGDCMEFHAKMIECLKLEADSSFGPDAETRMRGEAAEGCRAAYADRANPVTAFVLELWSRCKDLPCPEMEACFLGGMTELSAPPGPYSPSPR